MIEKLPIISFENWTADDIIDNRTKINEIIEAVNQIVINSKPPELRQAYYADQEKPNHKCMCLACKPLKREQNV